MAALIVNADDFGYTPGVNRAVLALSQSGALSSATVMATGKALPHAPAPLSTHPPHYGCHIVLLDGTAAPGTLPQSSLLQPGTGNGVFRASLGHFVTDLLRGRIREQDIEQQAIAQIERLQLLGYTLTHLDTHKHTHLFPAVLRPVLRAAARCGIRAIRNPFEPPWARSATPNAPWLRRFEVSLLQSFRQTFYREVTRAGLCTTAGALGVLATGTLHHQALRSILEALERHGEPDACYELVCHPGFVDQELQAMPTRLKNARQLEFQALQDVVPAWTASSHHHQLISFAALATRTSTAPHF